MLTLKMTTAQVAETSVTVNNNSLVQDYTHPHDHAPPTYEMAPGFTPFKIIIGFLLFIPLSPVPLFFGERPYREHIGTSDCRKAQE